MKTGSKSSRRFRLGPATTFAIAAGIVIAYVKWPDYAREAEAKRQLEARRVEIARRGPTKSAPQQSLDTLWTARAMLQLSSAQTKSLSILQAQEIRSTADLTRDANVAATEFSRWMNQHKNGVTMSDIQSHAATYSAKSGELARARREFWNRGLAVLTPAQRAQLHTQTTS